MGRTLLDLQFDGATPYNSAAAALTTTAAGAAIKTVDEGFALAPTSRVKVAGPDLAGLDTFTVSAIVRPAKLGRRQVILESQSPPLRIYLTNTGVVKGGVHTAQGWQEVSSGRPIAKAKETVVRMSRDAKGVLRLEVGGKAVAEKQVGGLERLIARVFEHVDDPAAHGGIVFDDKNDGLFHESMCSVDGWKWQSARRALICRKCSPARRPGRGWSPP